MDAQTNANKNQMPFVLAKALIHAHYAEMELKVVLKHAMIVTQFHQMGAHLFAR